MNNRVKRLAERMVEAFPELKEKESQVANLIHYHIRAEVKNLNREIDRLVYKGELGDYMAMLKIIRIVTANSDLGTDKEREKSCDFLSKSEILDT